VHRMAVDPDLRGRGTGSELLQQAETLALSLGLTLFKNRYLRPERKSSAAVSKARLSFLR